MTQQAQCVKDIEEMMKRLNAPQNVQSVVNNTGSKYGKVMVEKALKQLEANGTLVYMEVGKSGKLYIYNQDKLPVFTPEQIKETEQTNESLRKQIEELHKEVALQTDLNVHLNSLKSDAELKQLIEQTKQQIEKQAEQLKTYDGIEPITEQQMEAALKKLKQHNTIMSQRRAVVRDIVSQIAEGSDKAPKEIAETAGVDFVDTPDKAKIKALLAG